MAGDGLEAEAQTLTESVERLTASVKDLVRRTSSNRRAIRVAFVSIAVDVVLTVGALFAGVAFAHLAQDQGASKDAQCSLYGLIFDSDTSQRRAAMTDQERADFDRTLTVIRRDANNLGCEES